MTEPSSTPTSLASHTGRTWDDASSPAAARLARRFEEDWKRSQPGSRPDPCSYLPEDPEERPGAWLALLRADIGLRWEGGEAPPVEQYRRRYPDLDPEVLVGLLYEEFCLREETGTEPDPRDYERRFPELAPQLRRVFDIHALVGGPDAPTMGSLGASTMTSGQPRTTRAGDVRGDDRMAFPEAGETIGGFRLIEELGRGSFARVYLAQERLLADRPVALKVATAGSREPQTLARLQHTHIVPVHSYRVDPISGLHLLCMPYFGRTTLADVLADPGTLEARTGLELLGVLDRLEPPDEGLSPSSTSARRAMAGRSFSGATAWWGARLAEALQHAHDRGVLHRDVKPSNVLVTGDGLPMLLDFNLAMGPRIEGADEESETLGGTLAYMAPEHIEALADGIDSGVDARADVFALGVVLFEAITGSRPFPVVRKARSVAEALLQTAQQRRDGPPPLRRGGRAVSPALEAVIRRSLEPEPARRYQSAAELAADLQAVADDRPLRVASEPIGSRSLRWVRRNRLRFAVAGPVVVAGSILVASLLDARIRRVEAEGEVRRNIDQADLNVEAGKLEQAIQGYQFAKTAASRHPSLRPLWWEAEEKRLWATHTYTLELMASEFFSEAEWLRYRLFGFVEPERPPGEALRTLLDPFDVFDDLDWAANPDFDRLQADRRRLLLDEVPELLFLRAVHLWLTGPGGDEASAEVADLRDRAVRAMPSDDPRREPWDLVCRQVGVSGPAVEAAEGASLGPDDRPRHLAEAAFLWGIAYAARFQETGDPGDSARAMASLEAAARGRPDSYWPRFYLATFAMESGRVADALRHADAAVALNPGSPWALFNRAMANRATGDSAEAMGDLRAAAARVPDRDRDRLRDRVELNLGLVLLDRGDLDGARAAFRSVLGESTPGESIGGIAGRLAMATSPALGGAVASSAAEVLGVSTMATGGGSRFSRAARLDLARLDAEAGRTDLALLSYGDLLLDDPEHREARFGRALLALALGAVEAAEADADLLLLQDREGRPGPGGLRGADSPSSAAEVLDLRARCRLATGRAGLALDDATEARRRSPSPSRDRLLLRARLAARPGGSLRLDDPSTIDLMPAPGPGLVADLRHAADSLAEAPSVPEPSPVPRMLTRAVLRSMLGESAGAEDEATDAVLLAPDAALPRLVRARIRHRAGELSLALDDLDASLMLRPDDPDARTLRGLVLAELGRPGDAMAELNRAQSIGGDDAVLHRARALALAALGREDLALRSLTEALDRDPHDPRLALLRARLQHRSGRASAARADLDHARSWASDRPELRLLVLLARSLLDAPAADSPAPGGAESAPAG
jgi:serine/threonine protein kinase/Tfp pilus assembly protein PilF